MMDAKTALYTRRSIRAYTGRPLTDEEISDILRAGFSAPSCANLRPLHFIVVRERATLELIVSVHPHSKAVLQAGCCIVVCADRNLHDNLYYDNQDASAAIENMLLMAHGMGLGGLWMGLRPDEDKAAPIAAALGLPGSVLPFGLVAVGEPAEEKDAPDRTLPDRVHWDRW